MLSPKPSLSDFHEQEVVLWGLGRETWAVLNACVRNGVRPHLTVFNDSPLSSGEEELLAQFQFNHEIGVRVLNHSDFLAKLQGEVFLVKSPGVSIYKKEIQDALKHGVILSSATNLWYRQRKDQGKIIIVTGTKGKSTTSLLLATCLESLGKIVRFGGNVGTPLLDLCADTDIVDYWVLELSSYQLTDIQIEADVAVLLNLYPEHVDWHGSVERYYQDKLNILSTLRERSVFVNNAQDLRLANIVPPLGRVVPFNSELGCLLHDGKFCLQGRELFSTDVVPLYGEHNLSNVCAVLTTLSVLGLNPAQAESAIQSFRGLPHRLARAGEVDGVLYVNDSISTVPQSAVAAFSAFRGRWITALLGGFERAQNWDELAEGILASDVREVVTLPDCGEKIAAALKRRCPDGQGPGIFAAQDLSSAVHHARKVTPPGGVVLLSPAAPSYGRFKNFEERGRAFVELVNSLPES